MTPAIESDIPIPKRGLWHPVLDKMQPGQSVKVANHQERRRVLVSAKRFNIKVTSRKLDGDGYRIWRLE